jgi:hypothetical protein
MKATQLLLLCTHFEHHPLDTRDPRRPTDAKNQNQALMTSSTSEDSMYSQWLAFDLQTVLAFLGIILEGR